MAVGLVGHRHAATDPLERLVHPFRGDRLHQEVERAQLEGGHSGGVERADEYERGRAREGLEHAGELEPVELGHPHVEEDRVVGAAAGLDDRLVAAGRGLDVGHARVRPQDAGQILELGWLVVDGENTERVSVHAALTPTRNLGTTITTVVPCAGSVSISSP